MILNLILPFLSVTSSVVVFVVTLVLNISIVAVALYSYRRMKNSK